jgi:hypothetical protein
VLSPAFRLSEAPKQPFGRIFDGDAGDTATKAVTAPDARLTKVRHYRVMADQTETEDEIKKAEQHEALKQMFLRLLDDPQVQQKIVAVLSRRLGQIRGK